jgi:hypothetical protein
VALKIKDTAKMSVEEALARLILISRLIYENKTLKQQSQICQLLVW